MSISPKNEAGGKLVEPNVCRVLSVDGGGYLGLASAAFIREIERHFEERFSERFDLFCGTSTGGIIALALAVGKSGEDLVNLYKVAGPKIFGNPRRWPLGLYLRAKYDSNGLRQALVETFGSLTLGDILKRGKKVLIPAFNVSNGTPRVFKTDHSEHLSRDSNRTLVDVAMATSAAPTYFPLVNQTDDGVEECFCDGGVVANHPALMGFVEAISELKVSPRGIRLLSISTPRKSLASSPSSLKNLDRGILTSDEGVRWGVRLAEIMTDSNSNTADFLLQRIVNSYDEPRPIYERIKLENKHSIGMDEVNEQSTNELERVGRELASSNQVRPRVERILGDS